MANYIIADFDEIEVQECSCGYTQRGFVSPDNPTATLHIVEISEETKTHYHKKLTEIYLILEGHGAVELDGKLVPVKPLTAILIRPLCRHRAVGRMRIANVVIPAFDPKDEYFD
jgi:mannose-6-phosphate isomerase-like protein (cupin superfamily)